MSEQLSYYYIGYNIVYRRLLLITMKSYNENEYKYINYYLQCILIKKVIDDSE